jgi:hypothetical protein
VRDYWADVSSCTLFLAVRYYSQRLKAWEHNDVRWHRSGTTKNHRLRLG